ncbi:MAG: restriction endonuclease subunit S, partial [Cyanobacteriota bacterium]|nr:restriction endonuclease subunit S [Cyanobacteriota bacterium]
RYLLHFLRQERVLKAGERRMTGSAGQKRVPVSFFEELEIPLPPLEEQRRIAAILDKASTIKQKSAKASALAESLCIARLEQLIATNETLLVGRRLEDLCILGAPITYGILQPGPDMDGGIPYVRPSEIKNSRIDIKSLKRTSPEIAAKYRKSELQEGDLLFTIVGTIGEAAVVPAELEGANITQSSARIRIDTAQADPAYVYYSLKSQHTRRQISRDRLGVAVERLNLHHVRGMEILCLPMEIQNAYAKEVHCMMQLTSRHSLTARHISSLFQSLTSSLLASGERQ